MPVARQKGFAPVVLCGGTGPFSVYRKRQKRLDILGDDPGCSCQQLAGFRPGDFRASLLWLLLLDIRRNLVLRESQ